MTDDLLDAPFYPFILRAAREFSTFVAGFRLKEKGGPPRQRRVGLDERLDPRTAGRYRTPVVFGRCFHRNLKIPQEIRFPNVC